MKHAYAHSALGEAMASVARATGLSRAPAPVASAPGEDEPSRWIEAYAECLRIEAEPVEASYAELGATLASLGPSIVKVDTGYLAVLRSSRRSLLVLTPEHRRARLPIETVRRALTAHLEGQPAQHVEKWLAAARVPKARTDRARAALLAELVADRPIEGIWLLRADPGAPFVSLLRQRHASRRVSVFVAASILNVALAMGAWVLIGAGAIKGVVETGWLVAWALLSFSNIPLDLLATHSAGALAIEVASLLKQRLLSGALRIAPDSIRMRGAGELLAMVSESEAVEGVGLSGALGLLLSGVQLVSAAAVLAAGAGGVLHVSLLLIWTGILVACALRFARARGAWTRERFAITGAMVENVVGHRTRMAQQLPHRFHLEEDEQLERYHALSRAMDREGDLMASMPARGWLAFGLLGLFPAVLGGAQVGPLVIAVGGVLQAQAAFTMIAVSLGSLLGAGVSFRSVAALFRAASEREAPGLPEVALGRPTQTGPALEVKALSFRYPNGDRPLLSDCELELKPRDRVLLEGASGGGKSTLAAVLSGLRTPASGVVLLGGLDRSTLGGNLWRQRVVAAPQFHENHVLSGTLAFNLLMGRGWPASREDRKEAELICRELLLGPLIDRMPSGLDQVIGETGWQLSHGERSRLFLARALLQRPDVMILDESFGALDPLTQSACVAVVLSRAPALIVIAHP